MNRSFRVALLISMVFHGVVLLPLPLPYFKRPSVQKEPPALKITYVIPRAQSQPKLNQAQQPKERVITAQQRPAKAADQAVQLRKKPNQQKSAAAAATKPEEKIELPAELPEEKQELYLDYYRSIRKRIRQLVLKNYPQYIDCGEVYLYFVLLSNGRLKQLSVIEKKSIQSHRLKEIAKKSVRQAAPFLPFPKELNLPQLSFNVIISFEVEK